MSVDHSLRDGGQPSGSSAVSGVAKVNKCFEDGYAYVQSGPNLSNVDRGKEGSWNVVDGECCNRDAQALC